MPALLLIVSRPTPVLLQEQLQPLGRRTKVFFGVHRSKHRVFSDAFVELGRKLHKCWSTADEFIKVSANRFTFAADANSDRLNFAGFFKSITHYFTGLPAAST